MPKEFLRSFTGGLANEIDPQNLRNDQAVTARDIDVKGFSLEPGDIADTNNPPEGYYKYRGEWLDDPDARSFEEFGDSVIKTYDNRRPELEQIKAGANPIKSLGCPKQPATEVSGSIISEGSIGEDEAIGSHMITLDRYPPFKIYHKVNCTFNASNRTISWAGQNHNEIGFAIDDLITISKSVSNNNTFEIEEIKKDYIKVKTGTRQISKDVTTTYPSIVDEAGDKNRDVFCSRNGTLDSWLDTLTGYVGLSGYSTYDPLAGDTILAVHFYDGGTNHRPEHWLQKDSDTVLTLHHLFYTSGSGIGSDTDTVSPNLTHWSKGYFFKGRYFICWSDSHFEMVDLTGNYTKHTVAFTDDTDILNASPSSLIHGVELVDNTLNFTQTLTGTVSHPSSYSGDSDDFWIRNNHSAKATILVLSSDGAPNNGYTISRKVDGEMKTAINSYKGHWHLKYNSVEIDPGEWVYVHGLSSNPPEIRIINGTGVSISNHTWWDKQTYQEKRDDGAKATDFWGNTYWLWGPIRKTREHYWRMQQFKLNVGTHVLTWTWREKYWKTKWHGGGTTGINNEGHYEQWGYTGAQTGFHTGATVPGGSRTINAANFNTWDGYKKSKSDEGAGDFGNGTLGTGITKASTYPAKIFRACRYTFGGSTSSLSHINRYGKTYFKLGLLTFNGSRITCSHIKTHLLRAGDKLRVTNTRWNDGTYTVKGVINGQVTTEEKLVTENAYGGLESYTPGTEVGDNPPDAAYLDHSYKEKPVRTELTSNMLFRTGASEYRIYDSSLGAKDTFTYSGDTIDAVEDSTSTPRVAYVNVSSTKSSTVTILNGNNPTSVRSHTFDSLVKIRINPTYLIITGGGDINVYKSDGSAKMYQKQGFAPNCLGMGSRNAKTPTHFVQDAWHYNYENTDYFIIKRIDNSLLTIKTGGDEPVHSMLTAPFDEPLTYYNSQGAPYQPILRGITKNEDGTISGIQAVTPYFKDAFKTNTYVVHKLSNPGSTSNYITGKITAVFEDKTEMNKLYLLIDWVYNPDSKIGLASELQITGALPLGEDERIDFIVGLYSSTAPVGISQNFAAGVVQAPFRSSIERNVVFFSSKESNIPAPGNTDILARVTFDNHPRATEYFTVESKDNPSIKEKHKTQAVRFKKGGLDFREFDSSEIGVSTFRVGAPNMYDPSGPNLDFYYRAAFVDEQGKEGPPSDIPDTGISGMDSSDDSIQILFSKAFFATAEPNVEKLRIYRMGGNHSTFQWLNDVDIVDVLENGLPYKLTITSGTRKFYAPPANSLYPYLEVPTDPNITGELKKYVNSEFTFQASYPNITGSTSTPLLNGKYRLVQVKDVANSLTHLVLETRDNHYSWSGNTLTWHAQDANGAALFPSGTTYYDFVHYATSGAPMITIDNYGYRDKKKTPPASLHTPKEDNWPPLVFTVDEDEKLDVDTSTHFQYIKSVGGIYFAAADANIRFSRYGDPDNWPLDATIKLDSKINGIVEHNGEGIVFTNNSTYRVRGTDPKMMVAFRVPDGRGLTESYRRTLAEFQGSILWMNGTALCQYNAGRVNTILNDIHSFEPLSNPSSAVIDGVYWLIQEKSDTETRYGYKINLVSQELRITETSVTSVPGVQAQPIFYSKNDGAGYVVTKASGETPMEGGKIGDAVASTLNWRSKELDLGEPNISKALVSLEVVYDVVDYDHSGTWENGIRGEKLFQDIINGTAFGGLSDSVVNQTDLQEILHRYDLSDMNYTIDAGGVNQTYSDTQKKFIAMDETASSSGGFDLTRFSEGDIIWGENLSEISRVVSTGSDTVTYGDGTSKTFYGVNVDTEPQFQGECELWWGKLPILSVYINDSGTPEKQFVLPPKTSKAAPGDTQTVDLYLNDLKKFRVFSIDVTGSVRIKSIGVRVEPMESYQSQTLHHSADVFWRGTIDLRFVLDGKTLMRKELTAKNEFEEKRIYLPSSSYGQRIHYANESRMGMVNSVKFNSLNLTQNA